MSAYAPSREPARSSDAEVSTPFADGGSTYTILESAHDAFISIDVAGRIIAWNRAAEETFGWSRGEALGALVAELIVPERFRAAHQRGLRRYPETGENEGIGTATRAEGSPPRRPRARDRADYLTDGRRRRDPVQRLCAT